jgi:hypothetical protein
MNNGEQGLNEGALKVLIKDVINGQACEPVYRFNFIMSYLITEATEIYM